MPDTPRFLFVQSSLLPSLLGTDLTPKQRYKKEQSEIRYERRKDSLPLAHRRRLFTGEAGTLHGFAFITDSIREDAP